MFNNMNINRDLEETMTIETLCYCLMNIDDKCNVDDNYLFSKLTEIYLHNSGVEVTEEIQTVIDVFKNYGEFGLPNYATVKRSRQKIQEHCPQLKHKDVEVIRKQKEKEMRKYYGADLLQ